MVKDVLLMQHIITFQVFLATLPELPLPFPLQLAPGRQCDQNVPASVLRSVVKTSIGACTFPRSAP